MEVGTYDGAVSKPFVSQSIGSSKPVVDSNFALPALRGQHSTHTLVTPDGSDAVITIGKTIPQPKQGPPLRTDSNELQFKWQHLKTATLSSTTALVVSANQFEHMFKSLITPLYHYVTGGWLVKFVVQCIQGEELELIFNYHMPGDEPKSEMEGGMSRLKWMPHLKKQMILYIPDVSPYNFPTAQYFPDIRIETGRYKLLFLQTKLPAIEMFIAPASDARFHLLAMSPYSPAGSVFHQMVRVSDGSSVSLKAAEGAEIKVSAVHFGFFPAAESWTDAISLDAVSGQHRYRLLYKSDGGLEITSQEESLDPGSYLLTILPQVTLAGQKGQAEIRFISDSAFELEVVTRKERELKEAKREREPLLVGETQVPHWQKRVTETPGNWVEIKRIVINEATPITNILVGAAIFRRLRTGKHMWQSRLFSGVMRCRLSVVGVTACFRVYAITTPPDVVFSTNDKQLIQRATLAGAVSLDKDTATREFDVQNLTNCNFIDLEEDMANILLIPDTAAFRQSFPETLPPELSVEVCLDGMIGYLTGHDDPPARSKRDKKLMPTGRLFSQALEGVKQQAVESIQESASAVNNNVDTGDQVISSAMEAGRDVLHFDRAVENAQELAEGAAGSVASVFGGGSEIGAVQEVTAEDAQTNVISEESEVVQTELAVINKTIESNRMTTASMGSTELSNDFVWKKHRTIRFVEPSQYAAYRKIFDGKKTSDRSYKEVFTIGDIALIDFLPFASNFAGDLSKNAGVSNRLTHFFSGYPAIKIIPRAFSGTGMAQFWTPNTAIKEEVVSSQDNYTKYDILDKEIVLPSCWMIKPQRAVPDVLLESGCVAIRADTPMVIVIQKNYSSMYVAGVVTRNQLWDLDDFHSIDPA
ncbi:hypothetical protein 2 [Beihai picorna-like virus 112]|uniref:hypothetical protein 2 n=1 Tax=Beihai picorna-like virus 112 TaxID=1922541 RepID=UPI0009096D91|nr:hypothetical protein 2 [Beihai picorna-like virus 112]APG78879.1 hypothetical protein 2 [Beihai picorna-like virus 112]